MRWVSSAFTRHKGRISLKVHVRADLIAEVKLKLELKPVRGECSIIVSGVDDDIWTIGTSSRFGLGLLWSSFDPSDTRTSTMSREDYRSDPYRFDAGPLGHIEGLTVSQHSEADSSKPSCHYFGGLPYALPPVGQYRFRKARPLPEHYRYGTKANPGRFSQKTAVCPQPSWRGAGENTLWDEDCLQLNIYIPSGEVPKDGWPVFFYIHGGFLQWGSANEEPTAIAPLLSETAFRAIIVMPAYRLNAFGFLTSRELQAEAQKNGESVGNMGFWDQRLALEWTWTNIAHFGGNACNITVGGYSAGAHGAFQQLAHELYFVPDEKAIIRRVTMWSNSPGVQPKTISAHQKQFDELLEALKIPRSLPAAGKLQRLRSLPPQDIVSVQDKMTISEFRALTDNRFVPKDLLKNINSGDFAHRMKARGIKLMNGECRDEHNSYQSWRTPAPSFDAVYTRLCADYPEPVVAKLMDHYCGKHHSLPPGVRDWQNLFGHLYANMQVHCLERGFHDALVKGGLQPGTDLLRYRFDWRAQCVQLPPEWGVTHATDMAIWFWGQGRTLTDEEKEILRPWNNAFAAFVRGDDDVEWGTATVKEMRRLDADGTTSVWQDDKWEEGIEVWRLLTEDTDTSLLGWVRSKL